MANCHHRRVPLLTLALVLCLPCIIAVTVLSVWPQMRCLVPSSSLQPSRHEDLRFFRQRNNGKVAFLAPGAASLRGRRPYQEDRLLCAPGLRVPHSVSGNAGLFGVFDGHLGDAASDFAARSMSERFLHHASARLMASSNMSISDLQWFKASLLAAISDIDTAFGKVAATHGLKSGSTACVALQVQDQIIVANVGDSRAFFCSSCERERHRNDRLKHIHDSSASQAGAQSRRRSRNQVSRRLEDPALQSHSEGFCAKRLSSDHKPDRPDEKLRIEASGGFVTNGSLPRVNGQLAVSRSIGDIDLRRYGVIAEPEVSGWHRVSENDRFLILASDGIFEKMSPDEVCDVLHALEAGMDLTSIMDLFEKNNDAVIALPSANFLKGTSSKDSRDSFNVDVHALRARNQPLTTSLPKPFTEHTCQVDDSSLMTLMPNLECAPSYAQILAQILVEIAFQAGSMDNLSAIVIPLKA